MTSNAKLLVMPLRAVAMAGVRWQANPPARPGGNSVSRERVVSRTDVATFVTTMAVAGSILS
jgi:hypothetical protein